MAMVRSPAILGLLALLSVSVQGHCPDFWTKAGDNCYKTSPGPMTWHDAQQYCTQQGGNLIEIRGQNIQSSLSGFLLTDTYYWIGLTDLANEGDFVWWSDSQPATSSYTAWSYAQPDNNKRNEHCVHLLSWDNFKWNDVPCNLTGFNWLNTRGHHNLHALCQTTRRVCVNNIKN